MSNLKLAAIITMFDEVDLVRRSISNIRKEFPDSFVVVVQSDNGQNNDFGGDILHVKLPNLFGIVEQGKLPAHAICRNYSTGFQKLYESGYQPDMVVGLTGDTLVTDAKNFARRYGEMKFGQYKAIISQAIGAKFHSQDPITKERILEDRLQHLKIADFAATLFLIDGKFALKTRVFENIAVTNEFTSEQCLGDELYRAMGCQSPEGFHLSIKRLNAHNLGHTYAYNDGIMYHAMSNGSPGDHRK